LWLLDLDQYHAIWFDERHDYGKEEIGKEEIEEKEETKGIIGKTKSTGNLKSAGKSKKVRRRKNSQNIQRASKIKMAQRKTIKGIQ